MTADHDQFDDPNLKRAIRRACGRERAPHRLHEKVAALMSAAPEPAATGEPARPRAGRSLFNFLPQSHYFRITAAAAIMILAIGFMVVQIRTQFLRPPPGQTAYRTSFPESLEVEMIRTHDNCAKLSDHHLVSGNDFDKLRDTLSKEEGVAVFAGDLGEGWQFKGAGLCPVGAMRTAHLLFVKGDETVSIFSMPAVDSCGGDMPYYEGVEERHAIAGFVNAGVLYCVVASRSTAGTEIAVGDVQPLIKKMRTVMGLSSNCGGGAAVASR